MSKGLVETISAVFKPQAPMWACEITSKHVIVGGVNSRRHQVAGKFAAELPADKGTAAAPPILRDLLNNVGFKGSEIAVVVPDETARIAFLSAENPSKNAEEQKRFIRWKLKKTIPFDVDAAQVAYRVLGPHPGGAGVDMLVALSPRTTVEEYETLFDSMDIHAGLVLPSTLAALNLLNVPAGDTLFLKVAPDCVTTTVFRNKRIQFYRRLTDVSLYDAVYPTVMYYQDKLGGSSLQHLYVCGYDSDLRPQLEEIQAKLGLVPQSIEPKTLDDIYKPVLGSVHLSWQSLI